MGVYYRELKAGQTATKALLDDRELLSAVKTANETVTNSTTYQADNHLSIPVAASAVYHVSLVLIASGPQGADIKHQWTYPTGTTGRKFSQGPATTTTTVRATDLQTRSADLATPLGYGTDGSDNSLIREEIWLTTSTTAGTLALEWAQLVADASSTTVYAGSWMSGKRVA